MSFYYGPVIDLFIATLPAHQKEEFENNYYPRTDGLIDIQEPKVKLSEVCAEQRQLFKEWDDTTEDVDKDTYTGILHDLVGIASLIDTKIIGESHGLELTKKVLKATKDTTLDSLQNRAAAEALTVEVATITMQTTTSEFQQGMSDRIAGLESADKSKSYNLGYKIGDNSIKERKEVIKAASFEELAKKVGYTVEEPNNIIEDLAKDLVVEANSIIRHAMGYAPRLKQMMREHVLYQAVLKDFISKMGIEADITDAATFDSMVAHAAVWIENNANAAAKVEDISKIMAERYEDLRQRTFDFEALVNKEVDKRVEKYKLAVTQAEAAKEAAIEAADKYVKQDDYVICRIGKTVTYIGVSEKDQMRSALSNTLKSSQYVPTKYVSKAIKFPSVLQAIDALDRLNRKAEKLEFEGIEKYVIAQPALFVCDGVSITSNSDEQEEEENE